MLFLYKYKPKPIIAAIWNLDKTTYHNNNSDVWLSSSDNKEQKVED